MFFFFLELIKFESTVENNRFGPVFLVATVGLQLGKITPPAGTQKQITSPNTCLTFIGSTILNNLKTLHCIMRKRVG